jgi:hypothetical protein
MEIGTSPDFIRPANHEGMKAKTPYEVIAAILDDCIHFSGKRAMWFGVLYYSLRVALIVLCRGEGYTEIGDARRSAVFAGGDWDDDRYVASAGCEI